MIFHELEVVALGFESESASDHQKQTAHAKSEFKAGFVNPCHDAWIFRGPGGSESLRIRVCFQFVDAYLDLYSSS